MALVKATLETAILEALIPSPPATGQTPADIAKKLATAIDTFVKTADVTGTATAVTVGAGTAPVTGTLS